MAPPSTWVEKAHRRLAGATDPPSRGRLAEGAERAVAGNFLRLLFSSTLTKLGDRLASPKSTLAWLLPSLGAPVFFTGLVVPLRESGSLLPQTLIAAFVRRRAIRKWVWVGGAAAQGFAVLGMAATAFTLSGSKAGWTLVALLAVFSVARGFCSIAAKDVLGKTIPKGGRGRLQGWMASISGFLSVAAGAGLIVEGNRQTDASSPELYGFLLLIAGLLWLIALLVYARVREFPGETDAAKKPFSNALNQFSLLRSDLMFRRFVAVRALAMGSGLAAPFLVALAHRDLGGGALWLGVFTVVDGIAGMLSGPFWGTLADRSSRTVLRITLLSTGALLSIAIAATLQMPAAWDFWLYPALFFSLGLVHSGVRLGRKTYLVDFAEGNLRTTYVAVSNTVIGALLALVGVAAGLVALYSVHLTLSLLALAAFVGFLLARNLKDTAKQ